MKDSSWYPVNRGKSDDLPVKENIQGKLTELLDHMTDKHSKVLPVRFDLEYPEDMTAPQSNRDISRCMAKICQKYSRQGLDPHYFWTREQNDSHNPHYHCILLLNGNKVRSFHHVYETSASLWGSTIGSEQKGLVHHCTTYKDEDGNERFGDNGTLLCRTDPDFKEKFQKVHHHHSYLAKENTKAAPKDGLRDFGMSQINNGKEGKHE